MEQLEQPRNRPYRRKGMFNFLGLACELRDMVYKELLLILPKSQFEGNFNRPRRDFIRKRVKLEPKEGENSDSGLDRFVRKTELVEIPVSRVVTHKLKRHGLLYVNRQIHAEYAELLSFRAKPILHISMENLNFKGNRLQPFWKVSPLLLTNLHQVSIQIRWVPEVWTTFDSHSIAFCNRVRAFISQVPTLQTLRFLILEPHQKDASQYRDKDPLCAKIMSLIGFSISINDVLFRKSNNQNSHMFREQNGTWKVNTWRPCGTACDQYCSDHPEKSRWTKIFTQVTPGHPLRKTYLVRSTSS
ncbi:hypothetical protein EJ08DRAFT_656652 [Tothia fuscella]|uniref:Uncharacterized protein n=1 Tax=Tothia fuscella TaxID=1048955 RepID=A0A9P4P0F6_9PEZI|nr:hypothetical protein EJ08DRAFT_656652 [Tothia fuscella]